MKIKHLMVGTLICVLTIGALRGMETTPPQPSSQETIKSFFEFKKLCRRLSDIFFEGTISKKDVGRLIRCVKQEKVAELFSVDPEDFKRLFNTDYLIKFFKIALEENSDTSETLAKKAKYFRRSFKISAWETLLGCTNLQPVLKDLSKIYYFSGSDAAKKTLLRHFKAALSQLASHNDSKLNLLFNKAELSTIIDQLLEGNDVPQSRILGVLHGEVALDMLPEKTQSFRKYAHITKVVSFITALLRADTTHEQPSTLELLKCVRWDTFFLKLPELLGYDSKILRTLFVIPRLQEQLKRFEDGHEVTAEDLKNTWNVEALRSLLITEETLDQCINFDLLAIGLNKLRRGSLSEELKEAFNIPRLENLLGINIKDIVDADLPDEVRYKKFKECKGHFSGSALFKTCQQSLPVAVLIIFWLGGHALCHPCMEALEPQHWYTAGPLLIGAVALTYNAAQYLAEETTLKSMLWNTIAQKATMKVQRACSKLMPTAYPAHNELATYAPEDPQAKQIYLVFISLLTEEHLKALPKALSITTLFSRPRTFVAKHPEFIDSICAHDKERTMDRVRIIQNLLESVVPLANLPHKVPFKKFLDQLDERELALLPHIGIIIIAQYSPHLLESQYDFLDAVFDSTFGENHTLVYSLYREALKKARHIHNLDLQKL